ncbi:hypothetical protein [Paraburkholderia sp. J8-2]|uniref:hypothetical protein n=1 Tax=Paraburkholderia sp. J8-2 TaxID=2805440 RepID=UPI002AB632EE|nr:hypothetical protein [Paraburkholderia sp. J8-2]
MKPAKLFLRGFAGILSGRRKSQITLDLTEIPEWAKLVALVGDNGDGKTTLMDNLHPYRLMPSKCKIYRPSAFSYWDVIAEPLAQKQLDWAHENTLYRTDLVFKTTGKSQSQQAYLLRWSGNDWAPVKLSDGTVSDGSTATYDHCVESILGSPEVFFTTRFAAHKRKLLGDYEHADAKALLSAWLGHDELLRDSASAAEIAMHLRRELEDVQARIRDGAEVRAAFDAARAEVGAIDAQLSRHAGALGEAESEVIALREQRVRLDAQAAGLKHVETQRQEWRAQIDVEERRTAARRSEITAQFSKQVQHLTQRGTELETSLKALARDITEGESRLLLLDQRIAEEGAVLDAARKVSPLQQTRQLLTDTLSVIGQQIIILKPHRSAVMAHTRDLATVTANGTAARAQHAMLERTASLADRVPCAGSGLARECELLTDAREARAKLADVATELKGQIARYRQLRESLAATDAEVVKLDALEAEDTKLRKELDRAVQDLDALVPIAAKSTLIEEARAARPGLIETLDGKRATQRALQAQHAALQTEIVVANTSCQSLIQQAHDAHHEALKAIEVKLAALPATADPNAVKAVAEALAAAERTTASLKADIASAQTLRAQAYERVGHAQASLVGLEPLPSIAERLAREIEGWELVALALGRNGLVAFSIDDDGPGIAEIANDLLVACYGQRFSLRFETQKSLRSGALREGFEIMVLDAQDGREKPVRDLSGGQSVYVNDCLMRAVSLHLARCNRLHSDTHFSDETDGLLDETKKRQFVQLKRRSMEIGGYAREYFVTQSKEVQGLADYVINVADL